MKVWTLLTFFIVVLILGLVFFKFASSSQLKTVSLNESSKLSLSSCNILTNSTEKEECYLLLVKQNKDSSICRSISNVQLRGDCYLISEGN